MRADVLSQKNPKVYRVAFFHLLFSPVVRGVLKPEAVAAITATKSSDNLCNVYVKVASSYRL